MAPKQNSGGKGFKTKLNPNMHDYHSLHSVFQINNNFLKSGVPGLHFSPAVSVCHVLLPQVITSFPVHSAWRQRGWAIRLAALCNNCQTGWLIGQYEVVTLLIFTASTLLLALLPSDWPLSASFQCLSARDVYSFFN